MALLLQNLQDLTLQTKKVRRRRNPSEENSRESTLGKATLYEDEGNGYEYLHGVYARRVITCIIEDGDIRVMIGEQEGTFIPTHQHMHLELREVPSELETVLLGEMHPGWHYDLEERSIVVDLDEIAHPQAITLSITFNS